VRLASPDPNPREVRAIYSNDKKCDRVDIAQHRVRTTRLVRIALHRRIAPKAA